MVELRESAGQVSGANVDRRLSKRRLVALLLGVFVMGSGHAALGRTRRGLLWVIAVHVWIVGISWVPEALFGVPLLLIGALADVLFMPVPGADEPGDKPGDKPADRPGADEPDGTPWAGELIPRPRIVLLLVLGFLAVLITLTTLTRRWFVEAFKAPSSSMQPTIEPGEHFLVSKTAYWFSDVALGDIIVFANPCEPSRDFIKRVVALGDDTVEMRCNQLYINGRAVAGEMHQDGDSCSYRELDGSEYRCSRYGETLGDASFDVFYAPERPEQDRARAAAPDGRYLLMAPMHDFPDIRVGPPTVPSCGQGWPGGSGITDETLGSLEDSRPEAEAYGAIAMCAPTMRYRVPRDHVFVLGDNRDNSHDSRMWGAVPLSHVRGRANMVFWPASRGTTGAHWARVGTRLE